MKTTFVKGHKVNIHVGFNCATLDIFIKRRVGQLSKLFYEGKEVLYPNRYNDYDIYYITLDTVKYLSVNQLLKDVSNNIKVEKFGNPEHPRFIQELYRALS